MTKYMCALMYADLGKHAHNLPQGWYTGNALSDPEGSTYTARARSKGTFLQHSSFVHTTQRIIK